MLCCLCYVVHLEGYGETKRNAICGVWAAVGGFGGFGAGPDSEVKNAGNGRGGVAFAEGFDFQPESAAVELDGCFKVFDYLCDASEVPYHAEFLSSDAFSLQQAHCLSFQAKRGI